MEKLLTVKENQALRHIRNALIFSGRVPSIRALMKLLKYRSPRSAALIVQGLIEKGFAKKKSGGRLTLIRDEGNPSVERTVDVPLVGTIACGSPILAEENIEAMIPVSVGLARPPHQYFLLRAKGDSMTEAKIDDGDFVLTRKQPTAKNGDIVVALIDDEATLKEFRRSGDTVILKPHNRKYQPIILQGDFQVQGVVVAKGIDLK